MAIRALDFRTILFLCFVFYPLTSPSPTTTYTCIQNPIPEQRIFPTLTDYQHNNESFAVGTGVSFGFKTINRIPKNAFLAFGSSNVVQLDLSNKNIQELQSGAFLFLRCLYNLNLSNNNVSVLVSGVFDGLKALRKLNVSGNALKTLDNGIFTEMAHLQVLDLSWNQLDVVAVEAFMGLGVLEYLNLSHNKIKSVHDQLFSPVKNLVSLQLNSNLISSVNPHFWPNLTKLQELNLADNSLTSFDTGFPFSFGLSLKLLNISSNQLKRINMYGWRTNLPHVTMVDLNDNLWLCEDLEIYLRVFNDGNTKVVGRYESDDDQVAGIRCSAARGVYTEKTVPPVSTTTVKTTSETSEIVHEKSSQMTQPEVLLAIQKTQHLVVSLIIIILIFIAIDLTVRTGIVNRISLTRSTQLDATNIEQIGLLQK